jgi:hypothetical protein
MEMFGGKRGTAGPAGDNGRNVREKKLAWEEVQYIGKQKGVGGEGERDQQIKKGRQLTGYG